MKIPQTLRDMLNGNLALGKDQTREEAVGSLFLLCLLVQKDTVIENYL